MAKIACLTPLYFSDDSYVGGGERYPLNLSRGVVAASGGAKTRVSCWLDSIFSSGTRGPPV